MSSDEPRDNFSRDDDGPHQSPTTTEPRIYTKDDIEEMLAVADLLGLEFDEATLVTDDPEKITQAEAHMMAEIVKTRIHEGWMREKERQERKAGRHGGR